VAANREEEKMKIKEKVKLACRIFAFPFLVSYIFLLMLVFGDPTPEEEDC